MRSLKFALVGLGVICSVHATTNISVSQNTSTFPWGVTDTATYGQTVTVPVSDTVLSSFTVNLGPRFGGTGDIKYQAWVYQWDSVNNHATGSALYQSATEVYTPGAGYTPITFTPGVDLVSGGRYVFFLSTSGLQSGQPVSTSYWALNNSGAYSGGDFVFMNNGDNASQWTSAVWQSFGSQNDLAFRADFESPAAVPEPASVLLLVTMVGILGTTSLRKQRSDA